MKKYLIPIIASFFIISVASAFKPATLFVETWEGIKRQAVWTEEQAKNLFNKGYELDTGMLGTSITTINGTDTLKDSRTTINNNFTALNAGKIENATTSLPLLTTLANLSTVGTITTGVWNGTAIPVNKGGTGTTSPSQYLVMLGDGASGLTIASSTGASGQFLTSNGVSAYPSWQTSTVNQNDDYNWTGEHSFSATSTMATTTATALTISGDAYLASTTFTVIPKINGTPTAVNDAVNKSYADSTGKIYATTTTSYVYNTITETEIMAENTIPANTLGTSNILKITIPLSNIALGVGDDTATFKLYYGGSNLCSLTITNSGSGNFATTNGLYTAYIIANQSTSAQKCFHDISFGEGTINLSNVDEKSDYDAYSGTGAINSAQNQALKVTVTLSEADTVNYIYSFFGWVEVIR